MKKLLVIAGLAWVSVGVVALTAQQRAPQAATPSATPRAAAAQAPSAPVARRVAAQAAPARQAAAEQVNPAQYGQLVTKYCVGCHNERSNTPAANPLRLDNIDVNNVTKDAVTWERVIRKLAVGAMPPQGMPHPEQAELRSFSGYLINTLDKSAAANLNPGRFAIHRLNRLEYSNAIRDLVNVEFDAAEVLPSDGGGEFGFDNIATALKTSPLLLERYLTAALRVSAMAIGDPKQAPGAAVFPISLEHTQKEHVDGLPLGTRGGAVIKYYFPADAEYNLSGRLVWGIVEGYFGIEGHEKPYDFVVTVDGEQVYSAPIGGEQDHRSSAEDYAKIRPFVDARMTTRQFVTAGQHEVGFTWIQKTEAGTQAVWQPSQRDSQEVHMAGGPPRLKTLMIEGPYNVKGVSDTPSRKRVLVCKPTGAADENACAERIFSTLAKRAYRRAVNASDIEAPMSFYREARKENGNFEDGIRVGVARILASPSFIYRAERDPETTAGNAFKISDLELASRLSFFLWSSIPDDQLLNLAIAGRLREPGVLQAQVKRMIADSKADTFTQSFTGQWLQIRGLERKVTPDILMFPQFDDNMRKGFRTETELFFANAVRSNESIMNLINANYTFVNERLAKHYGIDGVYGERFRKVAVANPNRRGLLGQGSILALTSVATRTSPVLRGKYIMTNIMGLPEPVPPPNVPTLDQSAPASKPTSVRERLESHRRNPVCAACHKNIDPLGFSLEFFDSTGAWRDTTEGGKPVDAKTVLQDGTEVNGPVDLRNWLTAHPDVFVTNVTERMLVYALGRGLEAYDHPIVRDIVRKSAKDDYKFQTVILGIVQSAPFQMRTKAAPATGNKVAQVSAKANSTRLE